MNKLTMLKLWAEGLGIPASVFETDRFKGAFEDNDAVDSLRAVHRAIDDGVGNTEWQEWGEANRNARDPRHQLEFLSIMRMEDEPEPVAASVPGSLNLGCYRDPVVCW